MSTNAAVITGAAGGIGRSLVGRFESAGYAVIATDLGPRPRDLVCAHYLECDLAKVVTDAHYAEDVYDSLYHALNSMDLKALINNAAVQVLGGLESLNRSDWEASLNVNLLAPFLLTQALLPSLERSNGCVINISSIHARLTKKNFVAYATTKAALSGMTRALAVDLEARVRVNAIEPAAIRTPMLEESFHRYNKEFSQLEQFHPQKRIGNPSEIANLAFMMASDGAQFLHGACIPVDGGISARLFDPA